LVGGLVLFHFGLVGGLYTKTHPLEKQVRLFCLSVFIVRLSCCKFLLQVGYSFVKSASVC
jgi:hypothetical protein